jgi:triacylglycerol esterase/lipase EstA (alpha/beta hydrolase family)
LRLTYSGYNEQDGLESRRRSDVSFLERKFKILTLRRNASETPVETLGDFGLNLLHEPSECLVDFVFVHGLRGGSRKTWSASASQAHFWPKEWLPADTDFRHVRIHSFGYNSDWLNPRENLLNVHDFGESLIEEIQNNPSIRRNKNTRIVFIGHSMGGLVIKKACILSRENPSFNELGTRIHSIYFLATPHRGSDLAQTLHKVLRSTPAGNKAFIGNLERGSEAINILNDQFRHVCKGIAIHSFTESVPTNWGIGSGLVVDKQSATLGV